MNLREGSKEERSFTRGRPILFSLIGRDGLTPLAQVAEMERQHRPETLQRLPARPRKICDLKGWDLGSHASRLRISRNENVVLHGRGSARGPYIGRRPGQTKQCSMLPR